MIKFNELFVRVWKVTQSSTDHGDLAGKVSGQTQDSVRTDCRLFCIENV